MMNQIAPLQWMFQMTELSLSTSSTEEPKKEEIPKKKIVNLVKKIRKNQRKEK